MKEKPELCTKLLKTNISNRSKRIDIFVEYGLWRQGSNPKTCGAWLLMAQIHLSGEFLILLSKHTRAKMVKSSNTRFTE